MKGLRGHSNILQLYATYQRGNKVWIIMEYCGGRSIFNLYAKLRQPLNEEQIKYVARETLEGLAHMHKSGKIHRDIKGANILLTHRGEVKLGRWWFCSAPLFAILTYAVCVQRTLEWRHNSRARGRRRAP